MNEHSDDKVVSGFWVYLMSDCVLFAGLFATYAVLQSATFGTPGPGELFSLPFVLIETMILLTSSFTMGLAMVAAHNQKKQWAIAALAVTLLLGAAFLAMEVSEFKNLILEGYGPDKSASLSSFFALVGAHGLHVLIGSLWIVVLLVHVALRGLTAATLRKLSCLSLFWHFLDIIWIFIFTFVYLLGALQIP